MHDLHAAEQRVKQMQERSRQLLGHPPTYGGATAPKQTDDRWLLLLLILMLAQNGGSTPLLLILAYLSL